MSDVRTEFTDIAASLFAGAAEGFAGLPDTAQKVFLSFSCGSRQAVTVRGVGATLKAAFDAALERALKAVARYPAAPRWVMADIVEKEIFCPFSEYCNILGQVKRGFLRYGLSVGDRYKTAFLEQEMHANGLIKYSQGGCTLNAAAVTEYLRRQSGGTGVTFSAPPADTPVVLFETRGRFCADGEFFEIDSSPASPNKGLRKVDFAARAELRKDVAREVVAASFAACSQDNALPSAQIPNSGADDDALLCALIPGVMFPELAMFMEDPKKALYGTFVRQQDLCARDDVAGRFFTDYYNRRKTGSEPKIITTCYNPALRKLAETFGLSENEYENAYDFFQNAAGTGGKTGEMRVEKLSDSKTKRDKYTAYDCRGFLSCEKVTGEGGRTISETFFTPQGELVIDMTYRHIGEEHGLMSVKLKYNGTWRCFGSHDELIEFYLKTSPNANAGNKPQSTVVDAGEGSAGLAVSVIIPHYNRADLLTMCLDSIAVSDYPQDCYEVIVVDDCSTDDVESVRAYSKIKNYRFCRLDENSGHASRPRNHGISLAVGEYALFVDSDDMISGGLLSGAMKIARQGGCDAVLVPKISQRSTAAKFKTLTEDLTKINLDGYGDLSVLVASDNYSAGNLFRLSLIKRFGISFPENLIYSEDTCFCRCFYAVAKTMGVCASESYFVKEWDAGSLSHYQMTCDDLFEHLTFISRTIFAVPDEFAPLPKKARALDNSIKLMADKLIASPYGMRRFKEAYGESIASIKNVPRLSDETRRFIDALGKTKLLKKNRGKTEVVFMPYRASTWDSLESIWLAAKADPECDVYVVPLPYRTPNPDKSLGEPKCDGADLPAYVPVTHYSEYDIAQREPDIVYINDPYDRYNGIAPIEPRFHSYNLRQFTDMLIYVLYYVGGDIDLSTAKLTEPVYCAPNVDKIITQSEKYTKLYAKTINDKKLLALGSPKIDKVVNTKKEDCPLPDAWRKIIGGRKVVLYNVHLNSFRDPQVDVITKLRTVITSFKNRSDAVLWWRPHPSTEANITARNPNILNDYHKLIEEFKSAGTGIFDDTPDVHRALVLSDEYYGDWSSLIVMFGITGKPVMLQYLNASPKNENYRNLAFWDIYDDGENFWFTAYNFNALFKMSKQTWVAEYVGSFPNEPMHKWGLYGRIAGHGGKLYFAPHQANDIAVYDIKAGRFENISVKIENKDDYKFKATFFMVAEYKKYIFFIGYAYPAIVRLNTESGTLDYFTDWVEPLEKLSGCDTYYFADTHISENKMFLPAHSANAVVMFDMDKCVSEVYEVGSKERKYSRICFDGENYWLIPALSGPIVKWNPNAKESVEYSDYPSGFNGGTFSFVGMSYCDGHVWLIPYTGNMALKINIRDGSMTIANEFQGECDFKGEEILPFNYFSPTTIGDKIYAHTGKTNRLIEYDPKTNRCREEAIALTDEALQALIANGHRGIDALYDNIFETPAQIAANPDGTCGKKIHEYIKKAIRG